MWQQWAKNDEGEGRRRSVYAATALSISWSRANWASSTRELHMVRTDWPLATPTSYFPLKEGVWGGGSRHFVNEICLTIWEWGIPSSRSVEIEIYVWCFLLWSPSPRTSELRNMLEKCSYTGKALVYSYNRNVKHDTHEYWPKWIGSCVQKRSPKV